MLVGHFYNLALLTSHQIQDAFSFLFIIVNCVPSIWISPSNYQMTPNRSTVGAPFFSQMGVISISEKWGWGQRHQTEGHVGAIRWDRRAKQTTEGEKWTHHWRENQIQTRQHKVKIDFNSWKKTKTRSRECEKRFSVRQSRRTLISEASKHFPSLPPEPLWMRTWLVAP